MNVFACICLIKWSYKRDRIMMCMHAEIPLSMHLCMTLNSECSKEIKKMLLLPHKLQTVAEFKILSCNKIS